MLVVRKRKEMEGYIQEFKLKNLSVGFVPTMGYLHEGHVSLIKQSANANKITVCSIFVNPTQFNNQEDFKLYPKNEKRDIELLEKNGCDIVFIPEDHFVDDILNVAVDLKGIDKTLEGEFRPGHFKGVINIVSLLFNIVKPNKAYFGQKDFQQLRIVQMLAKEKFPETEVISVPIVRETDGLAMSSRNVRLSFEEKKHALKISQCLFFIEKRMKNIQNIKTVLEEAKKEFFNSADIKLEYLESIDFDTFAPVEKLSSNNSVVVCIAAQVGKVRLIDNIIINS